MDVCHNILLKWYLMKQIVMLDAIVMIKELLLIKNCKAGCLGCMLCTKVCPTQAITVDDFLAHIDYTKCIHCGKCKEKCPRKIIE